MSETRRMQMAAPSLRSTCLWDMVMAFQAPCSWGPQRPWPSQASGGKLEAVSLSTGMALRSVIWWSIASTSPLRNGCDTGVDLLRVRPAARGGLAPDRGRLLPGHAGPLVRLALASLLPRRLSFLRLVSLSSYLLLLLVAVALQLVDLVLQTLNLRIPVVGCRAALHRP